MFMYMKMNRDAFKNLLALSTIKPLTDIYTVKHMFMQVKYIQYCMNDFNRFKLDFYWAKLALEIIDLK